MDNDTISSKQINSLFNAIAQTVNTQANDLSKDIELNAEALGPSLGGDGTGGFAEGTLNFARNVQPARDSLAASLILQGNQQALDQEIRDQTKAASEKVTTAQQNYRARQESRRIAAAKEAQIAADRARQQAIAAQNSGTLPVAGDGTGTELVEGIGQTTNTTFVKDAPIASNAGQIPLTINPAPVTVAPTDAVGVQVGNPQGGAGQGSLIQNTEDTGFLQGTTQVDINDILTNSSINLEVR